MLYLVHLIFAPAFMCIMSYTKEQTKIYIASDTRYFETPT